MTQATHSVRDLVKALEEAGLPSTKPTIWTYEKQGVIKRPKTFLNYGTRQHRLYTEKEIADIVIAVRKHHEARGKAV